MIKCEFEYFENQRLNQIYDGFLKLKRRGIINLEIKTGDKIKISNDPILKVTVNNRYKVIYDTLDGFNWIDSSESNNLYYFKNNFNVDFYFKRSFNQVLLDYSPKGCKVLPLGLNYAYELDEVFINESLQSRLKKKIRQSAVLCELLNINPSFNSKNFEFNAILNSPIRILFLARLWDPEDIDFKQWIDERATINNFRIECVNACRKEFGELFIGGIVEDEFSRRNCKSLIVSNNLTIKKNYIRLVKECPICIATTGLHGSIGWKFGEYVAASRAIISEPLRYLLPGNFQKNTNYLEFNNPDSLIEQITILLSDQKKTLSIMEANFNYYNNYVKAENLILNTLFQVVSCEN